MAYTTQIFESLDNRIECLPDIGNRFSHRWTFINLLCGGNIGGVSLSMEFPYWVINEKIDGNDVFRMKRDCVTYNRYTEVNKYGLIGLSNINPNDDSVILTEGVSDYMITKILYPELNVLGNTNLTGSSFAKFININLFNNFIIIADNDIDSDRNTGIDAGNKLCSFIMSHGKNAYLHSFEDKDILNYVYKSYKVNKM